MRCSFTKQQFTDTTLARNMASRRAISQTQMRFQWGYISFPPFSAIHYQNFCINVCDRTERAPSLKTHIPLSIHVNEGRYTDSSSGGKRNRFAEGAFLMMMIIIIIIFIHCNWVVTRWQWLFYMYTKYEIGY